MSDQRAELESLRREDARLRMQSDVYALRWANARTGRSGWMPAVEGGWRKGRPASDIRQLPLTPEVPPAHLTGVHIGLYPLLERRGPARDGYEVVKLGSTPQRLQALLEGGCTATMLGAGNELTAEALDDPGLVVRR